MVGVLCVEMFVATGGRLLINELAPRPHNSGHLTVDAARHQPVRAAAARGVRPAPGRRPSCCGRRPWPICSATCGRRASPTSAGPARFPEVKLHLYGKAEARPGRKMGHLTALGPTAAEARETVLAARRALVPAEVVA